MCIEIHLPWRRLDVVGSRWKGTFECRVNWPWLGWSLYLIPCVPKSQFQGFSGFSTKSLVGQLVCINLMTLIRHWAWSPHYWCPLFSLFCDLSSKNHVQHTMYCYVIHSLWRKPTQKRLFSLIHECSKKAFGWFNPNMILLETWSSYIRCWRSFSKARHHANRSEVRQAVRSLRWDVSVKTNGL